MRLCVAREAFLGFVFGNRVEHRSLASLHRYHATQRNATQRNVTQRNAKKERKQIKAQTTTSPITSRAPSPHRNPSNSPNSSPSPQHPGTRLLRFSSYTSSRIRSYSVAWPRVFLFERRVRIPACCGCGAGGLRSVVKVGKWVGRG